MKDHDANRLKKIQASACWHPDSQHLLECSSALSCSLSGELLQLS